MSAVDSGAVFLYRAASGTWRRHAYLKASNTSAGDVFGSAVAIASNGTRLVAASVGDDSSAAGINGDSMNMGRWRAAHVSRLTSRVDCRE